MPETADKDYCWIYTYIEAQTYIYICIKRQNSCFQSWTQREHGVCVRAGLWLLSWAGALGPPVRCCSGCWLGHPPQQHHCRTETVLLLCFWAHCRKPFMPAIALLSPEIIYKILLRVFLVLYNVSRHCEMVKYWWMGLLPITWPADTWKVLLIPLLFAQVVSLKSQTPYHFPSHRSTYFLLLEKPNHHILCQVTFPKCRKIQKKPCSFIF